MQQSIVISLCVQFIFVWFAQISMFSSFQQGEKSGLILQSNGKQTPVLQTLIAQSNPCEAQLLPNDMLTFEPLTLLQPISSLLPPPDCGKYMGKEDWFAVVVPPSGVLTIETAALELIDISMACYVGNCTSLQLMKCVSTSECNTSPLPAWFFENLTPGDTLYIRMWDETGSQGKIKIRVSNPYGNPYKKTGSATTIVFPGQSNCIELTSDDYNRRGCAWYPIKTDFTLPFTYEYTVFLGKNDRGADGMCIVFQPDSNVVCGLAGGGIGAQGIPNSWIIEMDTWQNGEFGDPAQDHIGIGINGGMNHRGNPPVVVPNLENNSFHTIRVSWDPTTFLFTVILDNTPLISVKNDIVTNVFKNKSQVFWGITASTGGEKNQHVLCFENIRVTNREPETSSLLHEICSGDSLFLAGKFRLKPGLYIDSLKNRGDCDSIVMHTLQILPADTTKVDTAICLGSQWSGFTEPGTYFNKLPGSNGCDSTVITRLLIHPIYSVIQQEESCDSLFWPSSGNWCKAPGMYQAKYTTAQGCDSVITLDLTLLPKRFSSDQITACDSFYWHDAGNYFLQSGEYQTMLTAANGCDSIITIDLTLFNSVKNIARQEACGSFTWAENGVEYTKTGIYSRQLKTQQGCDSIRTLDLAVYPEYTFDTTLAHCDNYYWPVSQKSLNQSGTYMQQFTSINGCDSTYTLHLNLSASYNIHENVSACDSIRWTSTDEILKKSGKYSNLYMSVNGCDSTRSLELTIYPSYRILTEAQSCVSYIWEETGEEYVFSGKYSAYLKTHAGCDSVRILQLTVDTPVVKRDTIYARNTFYWPETKIDYSFDGEYEANFQNIKGCDSTHFLVLRLLHVSYPNIFSPNNDGKNDFFTIYGSSLLREIALFEIYDRWGNLVFQEKQFPPNRAELGWDGNFMGLPAATGVYTFAALLTLDNFPKEWVSGTITLIR